MIRIIDLNQGDSFIDLGRSYQVKNPFYNDKLTTICGKVYLNPIKEVYPANYLRMDFNNSINFVTQ